MKKKTYNLIKFIPFSWFILHATGNDPFLICSPMIADGIAEPIFKYAKKHPDVMITRKLGEAILAGKVK